MPAQSNKTKRNITIQTKQSGGCFIIVSLSDSSPDELVDSGVTTIIYIIYKQQSAVKSAQARASLGYSLVEGADIDQRFRDSVRGVTASGEKCTPTCGLF